MFSPLHDRQSRSVTDAADSLLLSLEVEAAAARNAELSRTVEELQEEVWRLRREPVASAPPFSPQRAVDGTPPASLPSASSPTLRGRPSLDEPREVFLALDDLLFEVSDIRSHLPSTTCVDLTPRAFDPTATVTARALRCVEEVRKLKEALLVSQQSSATQVAELQRALGEQVAANERREAYAAAQRATLERRCADLQRQYEAVLATQGERALNRVIQTPVKRVEGSVLRGDAAEETRGTP
jgi:cell division protein FtsB